jgi:ABC-type sulfate transport system substrate-binding protein
MQKKKEGEDKRKKKKYLRKITGINRVKKEGERGYTHIFLEKRGIWRNYFMS